MIGNGSRIVTVGSPHGDDRIGWELARRLREEHPLVDVVALSQPLDLLHHLTGAARLVVVDACRSGAPPGTIHRFTWPDARLHAHPGSSTHGFGIALALDLALALGQPLPEIVLLGIEVEACEPGDEISPSVEAALPELCERALAEIRDLVPGESGIHKEVGSRRACPAGPGPCPGWEEDRRGTPAGSQVADENCAKSEEEDDDG
jgi:hydrogenase maturation protease